MAYSDKIWVNSEYSLGVRVDLRTFGLAHDLLMVVYCGGGPFEFDPEALGRHIGRHFPKRASARRIARSKSKLLEHFFDVLPDGRWVPKTEWAQLSMEAQ